MEAYFVSDGAISTLAVGEMRQNSLINAQRHGSSYSD